MRVRDVTIFGLVGMFFVGGDQGTTALAQETWPQFRGVNSRGVATDRLLPMSWSRTENVDWAIDIAGLGWSSPVVWGDLVAVSYTHLTLPTSDLV